ncbi:MAG: HD domain-containing phosphohydrolase [Planctomycetota bacterium]
MAGLLGRISLDAGETERLQLLTRAHNIGYIAVPDEILEKPEPLTSEEYERVKTHPQIGCNIAIHTAEYALIAPQILHHHERWDGRGYPAGLKGKRIPRECRIFAVVDAYAAMIAPRPYRKARTREEALREIMKGAGGQFDPAAVDEIAGVLG